MNIKSFTNPEISYQVDNDSKTCSCMAFVKHPHKPCKHLLSIPALFQQPEPVNNYEAMSAFIKTIRLRHTDDAITWLRYLWFQPGLKSKVQKRILMSSGEDNMSVHVMDAVSDWHGNLNTRKSLESAAIEVARLCATDNWYAQPDGRLYMFAWEKAEVDPRMGLPKLYKNLLGFFTDAILDRNELDAMKAFNRLYADRTFKPRDFANTLIDIARESDSQHAHRLVELYAKNAGTLWLDGNISGQAVFALLNGDFAHQTSPVIDESQVMQLLADSKRRIADGLVIPAFARDGIHTRQGSDRRFAGTVKQMAACCRAYEYYGRLSPDDEWLEQFMSPNHD